VIWEFGGDALSPQIMKAVERVATALPLDVATLLDEDEVTALHERVDWLLEHRQLPVDPSGRRYPWPLV
jgi:hypothetical protein